MFNVNRFLTRPQKFILENNLKNYLYYSANKQNKLMIKINEDIKRKNEIQNILYGNTLNKTTNHSVNDLINDCKYKHFILIVSFVSMGALIFYKNK